MSYDQSIRSDAMGTHDNPYNLHSFIKPSREIFGVGVPLDSIGEDQWYYVDTDSSIQYVKQDGTWIPQVNWASITHEDIAAFTEIDVDTIRGNTTENIQIDLQTAGVLQIGPTADLDAVQILSDGSIVAQRATSSVIVADGLGEQVGYGNSSIVKAGANPLLVTADDIQVSANASLLLLGNTTFECNCGTTASYSAPDGELHFTNGNGVTITEGTGSNINISSQQVQHAGVGSLTVESVTGDLNLSSAADVNITSGGAGALNLISVADVNITSGGASQITMTAGGGAVIVQPASLVVDTIFSGTTIGIAATTGLTMSGSNVSLTSSTGNVTLTSSAADINLVSASTVTMNAPIREAAGSAGSPIYSFSGDTNSGIYSVGADVVGVSAGGTGRLSVSSTVISPMVNNAIDLGSAGIAFKDVFGVNAYTTTSDARLKKDIEPLHLSLDFVKSLKPVKYHFKDQEGGDFHSGLLAQDVEESLIASGCYRGEFAIVSHKDDIYGLKYEELIACLINSVKELSAQVEALKK